MEAPEISIVQEQVALRLLPIPARPAHLETTALPSGLVASVTEVQESETRAGRSLLGEP